LTGRKGKERKGKGKGKGKTRTGRRSTYTVYMGVFSRVDRWIGGWRAGVKGEEKAFMNRETDEREVQASIDHFAATFLSYQYSYTYGRFFERRRGGGSAG
jgi:hypothetical protein